MRPFQSFDPSQSSSGVIDTGGINKGEQIVIYNSSLSALKLDFNDKTQDIIPPMWGRSWEKPGPIGKISWSTYFTLNVSNMPASICYGTLYEAGEHVTHINGPVQHVFIVGNNGGIATTSISTLSQEGNTPPLLTIDIGDTANAQLITIYNDGHGVWSVDQSGTKHQIWKINTSGTPLQLGQSGDTTEILGNELVDGTLTITGDATLNGAGTGLSVTNNASVGGTLTVTGTSTLNGDVTAGGAGTGLTVTNNESVGGNLSVTGTTALTGDVTNTGKIVQNGVGTSFSGSVAGTVTFFTPIWGTALKMLIILTSSNYNDVTARDFVFPSAVVAGMIYIGSMGTTTVTFKSGSTNETTDVTSTLGGSSAGAHTSVTTIKGDSLGQFDATAGADRVHWAPGGNISNGIFIFIGA